MSQLGCESRIAGSGTQVMLCRARQEQLASDDRFIFLSSDASLQGGIDIQMTLEDSICRKHAHLAPWLGGDAMFVFEQGTGWCNANSSVVRSLVAAQFLPFRNATREWGRDSDSAQVIDGPDFPVDVEAFCAAGHLQTAVLPVAMIGHGKGDLPSKFEAVFSGLKLDVSELHTRGRGVW